MAAAHREHLERMSAPLVAWLIDFGYVWDNCGILDVTGPGSRHIREAVMQGSREIRGAKPYPIEGKQNG